MSQRRVVAVVPDLFFAARIAATAEQLGVALDLPAPAAAMEAIRRATPDLVILDLHAAGDPLALARALRGEAATRAIQVVGFYAHVDRELREAALGAGLDQVLPRSAFTVRLPGLLAGEVGAGGSGAC